MIGRTIGRYRIIAKLGEGGMGSVWKAEDTFLERTIALKFLPEALAKDPDARRRFLREARAASALDHPGIATVYDAGEADGLVYIALLYVDGETVSDRVARGLLPLAEAAHVTRCAAEALGHAHSRGVLHRDVSARNIMLAREGRVIVVDFGLALPEGHTRLTTTTGAMGTAAYMAPEMAQGGKADRRTDVYGLGVVLYEMLTGTLPFTAERPEALLYAAVHKPVEPPSRRRAEVPPALDAIVLRALAKNPAGRYQSAELLAADLQSFERGEPVRASLAEAETVQNFPALPRTEPPGGAPSSSPGSDAEATRATDRPLPPERRGRRRTTIGLVAIAVIALGVALGMLWKMGIIPQGRALSFKSVAVLPFRNQSDDGGASDYLAEGIGEVLVTKLTQIPELNIAPWPSVQRYADLSKALPVIAKELNVGALLLGTFRKEGAHVHGSLSLVDGKSGLQFWVDEFDQPQADLFAVLRQMALGAASKLRGKLGGAEEQALATPPAQSLEAFDFYLQGAHAMHGSDESSGDAALTYFKKAVEIDSTLADAYVGIGAVSHARYFNGGPGGLASLKTAEASFKHALRLKPDSRSAMRGMIKVYWENGQSEEGLKLGKQAASSGRETVDDLLVRADSYFLGGIPDKAVPLYRRVLEIDPANDGALWSLVVTLAWSGQFRETLEAGEDYFRRFGEDPEVHTWVGFAHHGLGEMEEARKHYERAIHQLGEDSTWYIYWYVATLYRQTGHPDKAREALSQGIQLGRRRLDAYPDNVRLRSSVASLYGFLGDRESLLREESHLSAETPVNRLGWVGLGIGHILLGEPDRGVDLLLRAERSGYYLHLFWPKVIRLCGCKAVEGTPAYATLVREFEATQNRLRSAY